MAPGYEFAGSQAVLVVEEVLDAAAEPRHCGFSSRVLKQFERPWLWYEALSALVMVVELFWPVS